MPHDQIDLAVGQLIGLFEWRLTESSSAWPRLRPALVIVLDELSRFAPQHPARQRVKTFVQEWDSRNYDRRH